MKILLTLGEQGLEEYLLKLDLCGKVIRNLREITRLEEEIERVIRVIRVLNIEIVVLSIEGKVEEANRLKEEMKKERAKLNDLERRRQEIWKKLADIWSNVEGVEQVEVIINTKGG